MPARTPGRIVRLAYGLMRSTSASPASISTPASRYVSESGGRCAVIGAGREDTLKCGVLIVLHAPHRFPRARRETARIRTRTATRAHAREFRERLQWRAARALAHVGHIACVRAQRLHLGSARQRAHASLTRGR